MKEDPFRRGVNELDFVQSLVVNELFLEQEHTYIYVLVAMF